MRTLISASAALAAGLVLAGCGGGSYAGGSTPPPADVATAVPDSAVASTPAMMTYLGALPASETVEPLKLPAAEAAATETDEPVAI